MFWSSYLWHTCLLDTDISLLPKSLLVFLQVALNESSGDLRALNFFNRTFMTGYCERGVDDVSVHSAPAHSLPGSFLGDYMEDAERRVGYRSITENWAPSCYSCLSSISWHHASSIRLQPHGPPKMSKWFLSLSVIQVQVVCWIQPIGRFLVDVLAAHPGVISLTFSRRPQFSHAFHFFPWPVECCSIWRGGSGIQWCVSWVQLWPPMVKCSSCIEHFWGFGHAPRAVGTQGCLHAGVRKILMNKKKIPLGWGCRSQTELWAALEVCCLLTCLKSFIFTPRIELHLTRSPSNTSRLWNPAFPLHNSLSPNKAWHL